MTRHDTTWHDMTRHHTLPQASGQDVKNFSPNIPQDVKGKRMEKAWKGYRSGLNTCRKSLSVAGAPSRIPVQLVRAVFQHPWTRTVSKGFPQDKLLSSNEWIVEKSMTFNDSHHRSCHDSMIAWRETKWQNWEFGVWQRTRIRSSWGNMGNSNWNIVDWCWLPLKFMILGAPRDTNWDPSLKAFCHSLLVDFFGQNHLPHRNSKSLARPFWFKLQCLCRGRIMPHMQMRMRIKSHKVVIQSRLIFSYLFNSFHIFFGLSRVSSLLCTWRMFVFWPSQSTIARDLWPELLSQFPEPQPWWDMVRREHTRTLISECSGLRS